MSEYDHEERADKFQMRDFLLEKVKRVLIEFFKNANVTEDKAASGEMFHIKLYQKYMMSKCNDSWLDPVIEI